MDINHLAPDSGSGRYQEGEQSWIIYILKNLKVFARHGVYEEENSLVSFLSFRRIYTHQRGRQV